MNMGKEGSVEDHSNICTLGHGMDGNSNNISGQRGRKGGIDFKLERTKLPSSQQHGHIQLEAEMLTSKEIRVYKFACKSSTNR